MIGRIHCAQCQRPANHCYCEQIVRRDNRYRVVILQSASEYKHPFNTGRMAQLSLTQCETLVFRNYAELSSQLYALLASCPRAKPVVVFPGEGAIGMQKSQVPISTPLLFIDDTWRKAKRLFHEVPVLQSLARVSLPSYCSGQYGVRSAKKHAINNDFKGSPPLSSLEAVTFSLGILEGRAEYYRSMLAPLEWLAEKQTRGLYNNATH